MAALTIARTASTRGCVTWSAEGTRQGTEEHQELAQ